MGGSTEILSKPRFKPRVLVVEGNEGDGVNDRVEEQEGLDAELEEM